MTKAEVCQTLQVLLRIIDMEDLIFFKKNSLRDKHLVYFNNNGLFPRAQLATRN